MLEAAKLNIKLSRRVLTSNLHEGLHTRRVGTNKIEKVAKMLTEDDERDENVVAKILLLEIALTKRKEQLARKTFQKAKRDADKALPAGWMQKEFLCILRRDANKEWVEGKTKNKKKKDHLETRYKPRKEHAMVDDIAVGDSELGGDVEVVEVLSYEVELNNNEKEYLKLPNSITDFVKIDVEKMKTGVQVMAAKLRMSVGADEDNSSQGMETGESISATRRVYNEEEKSADFRKKRVTDSGLNKIITVPDSVVEDKEVKIEALVNILENIIDKEAEKEHPRFHGAGRSSATNSTLNKQQRAERRSLLDREKSGELVIVASDKSGKRAAMKKELYIGLMEPHMVGDTVHIKEDVDSQEKFFNGAASQILKAVNMGADWGHEDRFKSAHSSSHNEVPSVNQLIKDHKDTLKTRPVCRANANQTPNGPLSELVGELLNPYIEAADSEERTEVRSTEELCYEIEKVNKLQGDPSSWMEDLL